MTGHEKQKLENMVAGMSADETEVVCSCIPSDFLWRELLNRFHGLETTVSEARELLKNYM